MPERTDQHLTDDALLQCYINDRDRDALGELIQRYAGLVYASARRQVGDPDLAEDVMQNVFVTFARRAREIRSAAALGAWLLQTTRFTSANVLKTEARRRAHESRARFVRSEVTADSNSIDQAGAEEQKQWDAIYPVLDEAISCLASADRNAVILRFLRGLSFSDLGVAIGTTEEAARKRVYRAIERLRKRLNSLGARPTSGDSAALTAILAVRAIEPVPASAVAHATTAAAAASVGGASAFLGVAITLWTKLTIAIAMAILLLAAGWGALYMAGFNIVSPEQASIGVPPAPVKHNPIAPAAISGETWQTRFDSVYALGPGQMLKWVTRPYIPERRQWYRTTINPEQVRAITNPNQIIFKEAADGTLNWQILFGDENTRSIALDLTGLRAWQIAGETSLLDHRLRGDWVYSAKANPDDILSALAGMISQSIGRKVRFVRNRIDRDVVVVTGQLKPNCPRLRLELTSQQILAHSKNGGGNFASKGGNVDYLLDNLSQASETPFIDELCPKTYMLIVFGATQIDASAATNYGLSPDKNLLRSLSEQSGLTFTPGRRMVDIWTLSGQPR